MFMAKGKKLEFGNAFSALGMLFYDLEEHMTML